MTEETMSCRSLPEKIAAGDVPSRGLRFLFALPCVSSSPLAIRALAQITVL
jgi:hypothetical protein